MKINLVEINDEKFVIIPIECGENLISRAERKELFLAKFAVEYCEFIDIPNCASDAVRLFNKAVAAASKVGFKSHCYLFIKVNAQVVGNSNSRSCYGSVNSTNESSEYEGLKTNHYTSEYECTFRAGPAEAGVTIRTYYRISRKEKFLSNTLNIENIANLIPLD